MARTRKSGRLRQNKLLADYGFKLGVFDEEAGDRYELVEA